MILAALQFAPRKADKAYNLNRTEELINRKADIVVLPELFATGYFFKSKDQIRELAELIPGGYTTQRLCEISRRKDCTITGALVEAEGEALYITSVAVGPDGFIGKHRKRHLTDWERQYYTPGAASEVFPIGGATVGMMVCMEGWFPESARELTLRGAQVICHTVLTTQQNTLDIVRARAMENHAFVAMANSCGVEDTPDGTIRFRGESRIIGVTGSILATAGTEEALVTAEIDAAEATKELPGDSEELIREAYLHRYTMYI